MLNSNSLKVFLFLPIVWAIPSLASNPCIRGRIPSNQQFNDAQLSIASDKNFNFMDGSFTKSFNKVQLPEDLRKCTEYYLTQEELGELETKWRWLALKYPTNFDYVFNYKLLNNLSINSMVSK